MFEGGLRPTKATRGGVEGPARQFKSSQCKNGSKQGMRGAAHIVTMTQKQGRATKKPTSGRTTLFSGKRE